MTMRMQELAERSGLPRTTIHHYLRESLLPPARKTAPNAAVYEQNHVDRLRLITRLRSEEFGELSLPEIRHVVAQVEAGVTLRAAVRLVREGVDEVAGAWTEVREFAREAAVLPAFVEELMAVRIIGDTASELQPEDIVVARACRDVCASTDLDVADLAPLASLIHEVGNYSRTLVEVESVRTGAEPADGESAPMAALEQRLAALASALTWRAFVG